MIAQVDADHAVEVDPEDRENDPGPAEEPRKQGQQRDNVTAGNGKRIIPIDAAPTDAGRQRYARGRPRPRRRSCKVRAHNAPMRRSGWVNWQDYNVRAAESAGSIYIHSSTRLGSPRAKNRVRLRDRLAATALRATRPLRAPAAPNSPAASPRRNPCGRGRGAAARGRRSARNPRRRREHGWRKARSRRRPAR